MGLVMGCVAVLGGMAHAQSILVQKPFSVKVGSRSAAQDYDPYNYFYAGATFAYAKSNARIPAAGYALYQVYVDYAARRIGFVTTGSGSPHANERSVGFGPAVTYHFAPAIAPIHPFVGLGVGYYNVKIYSAPSAGRLGSKVSAGLEFRGGFLGEIDYTIIGKVRDEKAGGMGLRLGYRF